MQVVGQSVIKKESWDKATGAAKYNNDRAVPGSLFGAVRMAEQAHARIVAIHTEDAWAVPGVRAILTGADTDLLCGEVMDDRPLLARGVVRYWGEAVALVVADSEPQARLAASKVRIEYEPLPVVNSPSQALQADAPLVHPDLGSYTITEQPVFPSAGTNIADHARIRKGDMAEGWEQAEVTISCHCVLPQIDHGAMETRSVKLQVMPGGRVLVHSSTQAPFEVQKMLAHYFHLDQGQVVVTAPLLGGAFGGKAAIMLEPLAYLASMATGGRMVTLANTREEDMAMSPVGTGLDVVIKLGATGEGKLVACDMKFLMDIGAYTDSSPRVARAIASQCTGPYHIENVHCDVLCVYTNHTYATAFRGFGHMPMTFAIERAVEQMARALHIDPLVFRMQNALAPGHTSPSGARLTQSNLGSLPSCLAKMAELIQWQGGQVQHIGPHRVRVQGLAAFWKTSSSPPDAVSGAIVTMNKDGTINLSTGAVEYGPGTKTTAAQILAEALSMPVDHIYIHTDVDTQVDPEHWKTVASLSTYMVGRAVLEAAEDLKKQLKNLAAIPLRCSPADLEVSGERVSLREDPSIFIAFSQIALGYKFPEGDAIGGQRIARGSFVIRQLRLLSEETGRGRPGPGWTVGVQAVEVDYDTQRRTYQVRKAATVLDAGRVINPQGARSVVVGGMCQGLGYGSREAVVYGPDGTFLNHQLRSYKLMRAGEEPEEYLTEFIETPQLDSPYGARPLGEHGVLAIAAALGNALSAAAGVELNSPPFTAQRIWLEQGGPA